MLVRKYKNFDDMFLKLVREILEDTDNILDYSNGILGYIDNMFLACKSWDCNLDLSNFGYKRNKWGHLLRTYVDYEELVEFHEKLKNSKALSLTYYFKRKKINNGSCLIGIVLSRTDRKKEWTKVNVLYRTTEIQRRFAADLVLVHHFIKELPECCKIGVVTFYMPQSYISAKVLNGYYDYFGIPIDNLNKNNPWIKKMLRDYELNFVEGSRITTYQSIARMQKLRLGLEEYEPIEVESLGIKKYFEKGEC